MKIAIAPNPVKARAQACAQKAEELLEAQGCQVLLVQGLYQEGPARLAAQKAVSGCDMVLAVGGDGTIIAAAKLAARLDIPVLGVNAGKLGFTAGLESRELELLPRLAAGQYREERRMMLEIILSTREKDRKFTALNDAVVSAELAKIIEYRMAVGGGGTSGQAYNYRADGFIVATPTGSTAYSLSAGGPVVEPGLDCMIYTPICPHSLFNRSVVFAADTRLTVEIPPNRSRLFLTVDGESPAELEAGDRLCFSRREGAARFIRLGDHNFYDTLNEKLLEGQ